MPFSFMRPSSSSRWSPAAHHAGGQVERDRVTQAPAAASPSDRLVEPVLRRAGHREANALGQLGRLGLALAEREDLEVDGSIIARLRRRGCRRCGSSRSSARPRTGRGHARPLSRYGLVVGVEDEVAAGRHLDPVSSRLEAVEEEALGDAVLRGRGLDRHVVVDEQIGGAQALLARVDPEGEVVQAAAGAEVVGDVDQLVRGDREAHPGALLGSVVQLDPLVPPVAEELLAKLAARADVGGEHVDVVEPLDRGAAADVALRLVSPATASGARGRSSARPRSRARRRGRRGPRSGRPGRVRHPRRSSRGRGPSARLRRPGARAPRGSRRAVRGGPGRPAATRSASGCSEGSRPSRAGRPTARRAPPPPSRARRRRSAGSRPASA